jgi:hypothetical protein
VGQWPQYDALTRTTMILDAKPAAVTDPLEERRLWWDGLWSEACVPFGVPL